ncbi:hypothetical protein JCM11251_006045 [Rhodosporidiobolus azoricus]
MIASESVLAYLDEVSSPLSPPAPEPHRLPRALLAAYAIDQDLKRAAFDVVQRLTSKGRAARKRARLSGGSSSSEGCEEEPELNGRRQLDLHVLLLPAQSTSSVEMDDDEVLDVLSDMGIRVHLHPIFPSTANLLSFTSPACSALQQALGADGTYEALLQDELAAAGFVFGSSQPCEGNEACQAFVESLAKHASTAFPSPKSSPTVTLYVPSRPATSDFDLDLPSEEVLSLRLVNSTAETFKSACPSSPPASNRRSRLSWGGRGGTILSPTPSSSLSGRGHHSGPSFSPSSSYLGTPTPPSSSPTPTSFKPLVLRPAPGPVQSISLRLTLDTSTDVLLRVQETLTPVDQATGGRFGPKSLAVVAPSSMPSTPLPRSPAPPRIVEPISSAPKSPLSSSFFTLRRSRSIKRIEPSLLAAFDGSQYEGLTKKPLARSDTRLAPADLKETPHLGELSDLLKGRVVRGEAAKQAAAVEA